jgi:hypothetical protein
MSIAIGSVPSGFGGDTNDMSRMLLIPLPPRNGGAFHWGDSYLSFGTDFHDARLRIAVWNDSMQAWRVNDNFIVPANGGRVNQELLDGDSKVSIARKKMDDNDPGTQPVGWLFEIVLKA